MIQPERIQSLQNKHQALDDAIVQENARPQPDDSTIAELKRQKLRIKDELASMHAL